MKNTLKNNNNHTLKHLLIKMATYLVELAARGSANQLARLNNTYLFFLFWHFAERSCFISEGVMVFAPYLTLLLKKGG